LEVHQRAANILLGYSSTGAPLIPQLQRDFNYAFTAGIKASMIPQGMEDSGFGQLVGSVLGTVLLMAPEVSSQAELGGSTQVFVGARNAVQAGDLKSAIHVLESLDGPAKMAVSDWLKDAKARVESDEALLKLAK
jgi:hypothetical protein